MALSLATKTVEAAAGTTIALPFHLESANSYYYPTVILVPSELGGCTAFHLIGAATTNATAVKTSAGQVYGFSLFSVDTVPVYVTFYDLAAAPTVDTSTIKMKFGCTANATAANGAEMTRDWPLGIPFATGIALALHKGIVTSTALEASEVLLTVWYK
jgi:hypothetical protein